MCGDHEKESNEIFGWTCGRCNTALSPFVDICTICNNLEEEKCIHNFEAEQDDILNNERLFATLKGN